MPLPNLANVFLKASDADSLDVVVTRPLNRGGNATLDSTFKAYPNEAE